MCEPGLEELLDHNADPGRTKRPNDLLFCSLCAGAGSNESGRDDHADEGESDKDIMHHESVFSSGGCWEPVHENNDALI